MNRFLSFNPTLKVFVFSAVLLFSSHRVFAFIPRCIGAPVLTAATATLCMTFKEHPTLMASCVAGVSVIGGVAAPLLWGAEYLSLGIYGMEVGAAGALGILAKADNTFKDRFWYLIYTARGTWSAHSLYFAYNTYKAWLQKFTSHTEDSKSHSET